MTIEYFILHRFDFILHANKEAKVYQMKFGGLYDCAPTKVHGVGLLIYDNVKPEIVSFTKVLFIFCQFLVQRKMKSTLLTANIFESGPMPSP